MSSFPTVEAPVRSRLRWLAFAAAVAAAAMDLLDSTIAQVAAPAIRGDLGGSYAVIQWVTASYALAMAVGLLTGGRLGDLYGRKRMLLAGLTAFLLASTACALAGNPAELIAARAFQGAAGAVMVPQVFGLMRDLFAPEEMGKAFGVWGPVMGLSAMLGPIASGGLIGLDLFGTGWRMIFLVNLPIGLAALIVGARLLPFVTPIQRGSGLDLVGVGLAGFAMFALTFPLIEGHTYGWPAWLIGLLVGSLPLVAAFAGHQQRRSRLGRSPLVEPSIFTGRGYRAGVCFSLIYCASMGAIILIFNVLLQVGLGFSPWHSALTTAPWAAGAFVGSAVGGIQMTRHGRRVLHAGLIVETAGLLAIYLVLQAAGTTLTTLELLGPMIIGGIGMGMVFTPLFDLAIADIQPHEIGSGSSVLQSSNGLGVSLGVAALGAIFFTIASKGSISFVHAGEWTALASIGLLALAYRVAFALPTHARDTATETEPQPNLEIEAAA